MPDEELADLSGPEYGRGECGKPHDGSISDQTHTNDCYDGYLSYLAVGGTVESGGVATAETWFDCVHCQGLIGPGERYRYWTCLEPGQQPLRVYSHRLCSKLRLGVAPLGDGIGPDGDEELADLLIQSGLSDCPLHATSGWSITTPVELFDHLVDLGSINWSDGGICIPDAERGQG